MPNILVSFCNTPLHGELFSLGILDTESRELRFLSYEHALKGLSVSGVTGLCKGDDCYLAAIQGPQSAILQLDLSLRPDRLITLSRTKDVHSMRWTCGSILAVSTGSNRIFSIDPDSFEETEIWCGTQEEEDLLHVNGLELADGRPIATAFGRDWKEQNDTGVLLDLKTGEVLRSRIGEPHSPTAINGDIYVIQSNSGSVHRRRQGYWSVIAELGPYCRGMVAIGGWLYLGISAVRASSRTTGQPRRSAPAEAIPEHFRCLIRRIDLETGMLDAFEVDLTHYGLELYDMLSLEDTSLSAAPLLEFSAALRAYLLDHAWRKRARRMNHLRRENQRLDQAFRVASRQAKRQE